MKHGKEKEEKKKGKKKIIGLKIFIVILFLLAIAGGVFGYNVSKNGGGVQGILATTMGHNELTKKNLPTITFVAMGTSQNLSDTIMLCSYCPNTGKSSILSIPRDTFTGKNTATANSWHKINALYQTSPEKTVEAVSELTGVEVENYVAIDTKALIELVDLIGGVWYDVPIDMDYDDSSQKLAIHLKKGYQLLDGEQTEGLLRFRHNNNGTTYPSEYGEEDIGRMRTQREFIKETLKQTAKANNIWKLGEFLDIASKNVKTNMDLNVVKDYLPYVTSINMENVRTDTLPGEPKFCNVVWLYLADKKETKTLVEEMFTNISLTDEELEAKNNTVNNETNEI